MDWLWSLLGEGRRRRWDEVKVEFCVSVVLSVQEGSIVVLLTTSSGQLNTLI